jgi:4-amino-4-deoxy-L-arabinose transferase-like glycosyltransferase
MLTNRRLLALLALIAAHVVLAIWYAGQTPYRTAGFVALSRADVLDIGAPDERQHANVVGRIFSGQGFGVFDPEDPELYENYQLHQPPAYYVLAAGWGKVMGMGGVVDPVDGLKLRSLNVVIGAIGVAGVFFLAYWSYGRAMLALAAAAFAALLPMNIALSGAISNDPLLICLCTWSLALLARGMQKGFRPSLCVAIGVVTGLALLTKTTALALIPAILLGFVIRRGGRRSALRLAAALGIALAMAIPWWIRNQQLYGDPFAIRAFNEAFVGSAQKVTLVSQVIPATGAGNPEWAYWTEWVGWWSVRSFLGVFGYMDIWLTQSGLQRTGFDENRLYWVFVALMLIGLAGWVRFVRNLDDAADRAVTVVNIIFAAAVFLLFIRFNQQYFQAQGRYLLPALGPVAMGVAAGYFALFRRRPVVPIAIIVLFFGATAVLAGTRLGPEFARRIQASSTASPSPTAGP